MKIEVLRPKKTALIFDDDDIELSYQMNTDSGVLQILMVDEPTEFGQYTVLVYACTQPFEATQRP